MDFFKKNAIIIFLQAILMITMTALGWSFKTAIENINKKANKADVEKQFIQHEILEEQKFKTIEVEIDHNKRDIEEVKTLYLYEIRELRKDLQLKEDKKK